jgi:lipopolysaccharide/colanic/teichoic acid biosynthesis glycosyltransferase
MLSSLRGGISLVGEKPKQIETRVYPAAERLCGERQGITGTCLQTEEATLHQGEASAKYWYYTDLTNSNQTGICDVGA